jgi:hypothetical protein
MRFLRLVLALVLILPSTLAGQSVLGSSGLGLKLEPLDAIQRGLGGVGVTTRTAAVLPGNPVASLDILAPTISFTTQTLWADFAVGSDKGDFTATRFPVFGFAYPLGTSGVFTLTAGSQFDQNWSVQTEDAIDIGGESVGITDTFVSDGGIVAIQAGWARRWTSTLALGVTLGVYRGGLTRSFTRTFDQGGVDSVTVTNPIQAFADVGRWVHSGPLASLNVSWDPSPVIQLGATVGWGGTIKVNPVVRGERLTREVSVPLEFKVSTIVLLAPTLAVNLGLASSDWTDLGDPGVDAVGGGRVLAYGAGVEWDALSFWAGAFPLRVGFHESELPFLFLEKKVKESTISFGFSIVMAQALGIPLAAIDLAFESGNRKSGDFKESFNRLTVTARVGGR